MLNYNIYYRLLSVAIAVVALLAPSLGKTSPAVTPETFKFAWSFFGVCFFAFLWLFQGFKQKIIIVKTPFYYPIIGFLLWCFISLTWAIDGYLASVMLAQFFSVALAFFLIVNTFRSGDDIRFLLYLIIIVSVLVATLGLLQYYFPANHTIQTIIRQAVSPAATFGNKNMAIHFIVMTLPLHIVFLLRAQNINKVILFTLSSVILSWFLIHSYTRSGWVSMSIELFFLALFLLYDYIKNKNNPFVFKQISSEPSQIKIVAIITAIIALLTLIMAIQHQQTLRLLFFVFTAILLILLVVILLKNTAHALKKYHKSIVLLLGFFLWFSAINYTLNGFESNISKVANRVASINPQQARQDGNERLPAWQNTLEMIKEHPLIGVGVGQWPTYYPLYYDRVVKDKIFNERVRLRHLHNEYLELLANVGLVGFAFLLWLLFLVMKTAYQLLANHQSENRYPVLGMVLALTGFATTSLFTFPIKVYAPLLFAMVYIALIANISFRSSGDGKGATQISKQQKNNHVMGDSKSYYILQSSWRGTLLVLTAVLTIGAAYVAYHWVMAESYYHNTLTLRKKTKQPKAELAIIKRSLEHNPYRAKTLLVAGNAYLDNGDRNKALTYMKKSIATSPYQTSALLALSQLYRSLNDIENEIKTLEQYASVDPKSVRAFSRLTIAYFKNKDEKKANASYQKMKQNFHYFKDRDNFGPYHTEVGKVAQAVNDINYAKYVFTQAIKKNPNDAEAHKNLGILYHQHSQSKKDTQIAVKLFQHALKLNPRVSQYKKIRGLVRQLTAVTTNTTNLKPQNKPAKQ